MRAFILLAVLTLVGCDRSEESSVADAEEREAAKSHFAQYDQITAFATASPSKERIAYNLRIKNVGSEPIVGIYETSQQWQDQDRDRTDLAEWNEHIPIGDAIGTFEIGPGEEHRWEAEPIFRRGVRLRFGFLVFCQVGTDDYRRLRVWTDVRYPESDFRDRLGGPAPQNEEAQQGMRDDAR